MQKVRTMKKIDFLIPLASALLPGVGTQISIAGILYAKRKEPRPELPEEVVRQNGKRFMKKISEFWIITGLVILLAFVVKRIYYYNHQIELLKNHHTEQVVTKQKNLR